MAEELTIHWVQSGEHDPPVGKRLLLIVTAAGEPPDAQLIGLSEVVVGYWTGDHFRKRGAPEPGEAIEVRATHWATLDSLPKGIRLKGGA